MYDLYDYSYSTKPYSSFSSNYGSSSSALNSNAVGAAVGSIFAAFGIFIVLALIMSVVVLVARWMIFKKANRKPWESLIPVHTDIVVMELGGIETYWYFLNLLAFIPIIGLIVLVGLNFWMNINLAKAFGKSTGFGVLMTFFPYVCYPILGFGSAQYIGPQVAQNNYNANVNYGPAQQYNQPNQQYNPPVQPSQPVQPVQPNNVDNNVPPQQ